MKKHLLCTCIASLLLCSQANASEIEEGYPKIGVFMYANTVSLAGSNYSLPVLMAGDLICTTYITGVTAVEGKPEVGFAQYCDPVVKEPIELDDGSNAEVITSFSAPTFVFDKRSGKHKFTQSVDPEVQEKVHHVKLRKLVYEGLIKGLKDKIDEFVSQRDKTLEQLKSAKDNN